MGASEKKNTSPRVAFKRQTIMRRVLIALLPALGGAIFFFGWRAFAMVLWVCLWGTATEYLLARRRGDPLTESCLVSCLLLALSLPPALPFWMAAVGAVVAISFGKELFGGFGRNVFNPAIVGRAFLYVCFPVAMTGEFMPVWDGPTGGLLRWGPQRMVDGIQAVSAATPMWSRRDFGFMTPLRQLLQGNIHGTFEDADGVRRALAAGSMGEVSAILLLLGGVYLLWTKTANWRLTTGSLAGAVGAVLLFRHLLGVDAVPPLLWTLGSGALLYACIFMVTDPISAPNDRRAQWIYAVFIGFMIVFFRWKAVFAGGVAFAILLGNTIGPTVEMLSKAAAKRSKTTRPTGKSGAQVQ